MTTDNKEVKVLTELSPQDAWSLIGDELKGREFIHIGDGLYKLANGIDDDLRQVYDTRMTEKYSNPRPLENSFYFFRKGNYPKFKPTE